MAVKILPKARPTRKVMKNNSCDMENLTIKWIGNCCFGIVDLTVTMVLSTVIKWIIIVTMIGLLLEQWYTH